MFRITQGKGFQIDFPNGWTISVQFGYGNYCDNRNSQEMFNRLGRMHNGDTSCPNAEVAVFKTFSDEPMDEPLSYIEPESIPALIQEAASRSSCIVRVINETPILIEGN